MLTHANTKHQNRMDLISLKLGCACLLMYPIGLTKGFEKGGAQCQDRSVVFFNQSNDYPEGLIWMPIYHYHHGRHLVVLGPREKPCNFLDPTKKKNTREKEKGH